MRIITVSREFGSGGRELGKRLADLLNYDYYDKEIIAEIAGNMNMDGSYVERMLDNHGWKSIPLSYRRSMSASAASVQMPLLLEQKQVIEKIAGAGKDCVIVGRNADVLLQEYEPFNLFVCADMDAKIQRCMERAKEEEKLSRREMEHKIRRIDKSRAQTREIITDKKWGDASAYQLIVNTTGWDIKELAPAVKGFADCWFGRKQ